MKVFDTLAGIFCAVTIGILIGQGAWPVAAAEFVCFLTLMVEIILNAVKEK